MRNLSFVPLSYLLVPLFSFLGISALAQVPPAKPKPEALTALHSALIGSWTGELQYRDDSNQLVASPTWLEVSLAGDKRSLEFHYLYEDGPSKVVRESTRVTLDLANKTFSVSSEDGSDTDTYQMVGADKLSREGLGTLIMTGSGTKDGKRFEIRITLRLGRNDYHYVRETRLTGESFQIRDAYNFTRRNPPSASAYPGVVAPGYPSGP